MMVKYKSFDINISLCRVLSMIMIIICHIGTKTGNGIVGQFFQMGVQVFLLISGYLIGKSDISNPENWIKKRILRILPPIYIFSAFLILYSLSKGIISNPIKDMIIFATGVQGVHHIFCFIKPLSSIKGLSHLWYITVIFLCYLLVYCLIKNKDLDIYIKKNRKKTLIALFLLQIILGFFQIRIDYFWIFFMGYLLKKEDILKRNNYLGICAVTLVLVFLRLSLKRYCDLNGDNNLYLYVIIPITYNFLAIWMVTTIHIIINKISINDMQENRLMKILLFFDQLSYFVYITHYCFIDGPFCTLNMTSNSVANSVVLIFLIVVSSMLLKWSSDEVLSIVSTNWRKK